MATMNPHPRASKKRKEMEALVVVKQSVPPSAAVTLTPTMPSKPAEVASSDRLLAGYMAYEFLTRGTLLGQKWDLGRAEVAPGSNGSPERKKTKPPSVEAEPSGRVKQQNHRSYADVAILLKGEGAHLQGIVNPTQLARWIQM